MIPDSVIDQVQDRCNIVDIIETFVPLKRAGKNFKGRCIFHEEKTPSFVVSPEKQIFHCFGCGASGNVFTFLMKHKGYHFREAVQELADRAGVDLPEENRDVQRDSLKDKLYEAHKDAAKFYANLLAKAPKDALVQRYIKKRGLDRDALLKFQIGYAPDTWDALLEQAQKRYAISTLERAGLILKKKDGGHYDRFRNRLIFPIVDIRGRTVGFGARAWQDQMLPKYLNSPETEIYQKGRHLYGLSGALEAIRNKDSVLLVEGYTDVIACFQAGVRHCVSSSGTAVTVEQVKLLKRYTKNVTVLFDADKAGELATLRGLDRLIEEDCHVLIARMPQGHDPDSYLKEFGVKKFAKAVLGEAESIFDYKYSLLTQRERPKRLEDKVKVAMEMLATIRLIPNAVLKSSLLKRLSDEMNLSESALAMEMNKKGTARGLRLSQAAAVESPQPQDAPMRERLMIGLFLTFPECFDKAKSQVKLEDFNSPQTRRIMEILFASPSGDHVKPVQLLNRLKDDHQTQRFVNEVVHEVEGLEHYEKAFEDCLKRIEEEKKKKRFEKLQEEIRQAEVSEDFDKVRTLVAKVSKVQVQQKGK